jgi:hypothetical protein
MQQGGMPAPMSMAAPQPMPQPMAMPAPKKNPKPRPKVDVQKWLRVIASYENEFKQWQLRVEKILKRYRDDTKEMDSTNPAKFNILWSNVQTAIPATFSRVPKPDVSRRHFDNDPIGRVAALLLERGLEFEIEHYPDYRAAMKNSVFDRFLGGRGVAWVRYEPHFKAAEQGEPADGFQVTDDADEAEETPEAQEEIDYECCPVDYVHWKDFGHTIARTWEEVTGVWRRVYMTRPALIERFGEEIGGKIPLDTRPEQSEKSSMREDEAFQACVYEIWDKETNAAIWLSKSNLEELDARLDPLELENFFPCPRPLFATLTTDSLIPIPDFTMYQDQAYELDNLANTIDSLIKALKVRGVHNAAIPELARLFTEAGNGDLIPVSNWNAFAEKSGLKGAIDIVDLTPIGNALVAAYAAVEHVKSQIYEITGLADIIRGSSDPRETATAVQAKGQFGSMRLRSMQSDVVQYATEILQIKAQIMCGEFSDDTLLQIGGASQLSPTDQQLIPQALQLIRNNPLRNFRIEVTSDSMIQMDEAQEKQDRMEFLKAAGGFLQNAVQLSQSPVAAELLPLAVTMMKFGVTGFKVGKEIEGEFDSTVDRLQQAAQQKAQQPPSPPPQVQLEQIKQQGAMQQIQVKAQVESQKFMAEQQAEQQNKMQDLQIEQQKLAMDAQAEERQRQIDMLVEQHKQEMQAREVMQQNQLEAQREALQAQQDAMLERQRMQHEALMQSQAQMFELFITRLNNANKIDVAEVSKETTLQAAQIAAANRGSQDDSPDDTSGGVNDN